uniref:Uncharacterized protein n=1 Tax=Nothobranchius kadleci TaxID=1051664 RepID=A0A1A8CHF1_NOTKA
MVTDQIKQMKERLKQDRDNLDSTTDKLAQDKMHLESLRSKIQEETTILQRERQLIKDEQDKLEITKAELNKEREDVNTALDQLHREKTKLLNMSLNVKQQSQRLQDSLKSINVKHQERQRKDQDIQTLEKELQNRQKQLQEDTEGLESLRKTITLVKDKVQLAMTNIGKDKEQVNILKVEVEKEKYLISNERSTLKEEWSKLETTKDELLKKTHSAENLRAALQVLRDKTSENIQDKLNALQKCQQAVQRMDTLLEQKTISFDKQKEKMDDYKEFFERQRDILKSILSETIKKRLSLDNHWKQMAGTVADQINQMKERLNKSKQNFSRLKVHNEKDLLSIHFADTKKPQKSPLHTVLVEIPNQFLITKCEKAIQTDFVFNQAFTKQELKQSKTSKDFLTSFATFKSFESEHPPMFDNASHDKTLDSIGAKRERNISLPENKNEELYKMEHATLTTISTEKDDFINQGNRERLRKIWKDTRADRREIDVLKHRGQKIRSNLEKRLKVISHFVERTLSFNEKTSTKSTSEYWYTVNQSDWNRDNKSLDKRYFDIPQLMSFTESEKRFLKEKESKEPRTGNKANQTAGLGTIPEQAKQERFTRISEGLSRMRVQEDEFIPETSSGFFCQLQHYCCRCCCPCCSRHKQGCPKKN